MKILLCASTKMELNPASSYGHQLEYLITGAGSPSTCFYLARQFATVLPDLAIQIGIAGAYDERLSPGEVVQVRADSFADLGAQDADGSFIPLDLLVAQDFPFGLREYSPARRRVLKNILEVKAITVNKVHGYLPEILRVRTDMQPDIESMEGAAFFACCMAFDLPCVQLRAISNRVESRNRSAWNIPLALKNLHGELERQIAQLE